VTRRRPAALVGLAGLALWPISRIDLPAVVVVDGR
jgi:hypothetical protein